MWFWILLGPVDWQQRNWLISLSLTRSWISFSRSYVKKERTLISLINFFFSRRGAQHSTKDSPFKALEEVTATVLRDETASRKVPPVPPKKDGKSLVR